MSILDASTLAPFVWIDRSGHKCFYLLASQVNLRVEKKRRECKRKQRQQQQAPQPLVSWRRKRAERVAWWTLSEREDRINARWVWWSVLFSSLCVSFNCVSSTVSTGIFRFLVCVCVSLVSFSDPSRFKCAFIPCNYGTWEGHENSSYLLRNWTHLSHTCEDQMEEWVDTVTEETKRQERNLHNVKNTCHTKAKREREREEKGKEKEYEREQVRDPREKDKLHSFSLAHFHTHSLTEKERPCSSRITRFMLAFSLLFFFFFLSLSKSRANFILTSPLHVASVRTLAVERCQMNTRRHCNSYNTWSTK